MSRNRYAQYVKVCALCDTKIPKHKNTCRVHEEQEEQYRNEPWFIALIEFQQRQYEIDTEQERAFRFGIASVKDQKQSKTRGKQLSNSVKREMIDLYRGGLGDRRIAKLLKLSYKTVNTFLWRYRKQRKSLCK